MRTIPMTSSGYRLLYSSAFVAVPSHQFKQYCRHLVWLLDHWEVVRRQFAVAPARCPDTCSDPGENRRERIVRWLCGMEHIGMGELCCQWIAYLQPLLNDLEQKVRAPVGVRRHMWNAPAIAHPACELFEPSV